jgi:hypothetical protein
MYVNIRLIIALHIQRLKDVFKVTAVLMKARNFEHSSANCFMPQLLQFYARCLKG